MCVRPTFLVVYVVLNVCDISLTDYPALFFSIKSFSAFVTEGEKQHVVSLVLKNCKWDVINDPHSVQTSYI